ncbi:MAG: glutamate 5-kinase [Clostridiaceae bacterium]
MKKTKCLVLKIGSSSLVSEDGRVQQNFIDQISMELKTLQSSGWEVIVVSSGAVAMGRLLYGKATRKSLSQKQALSAIGQRHLINLWEGALSKSDIMTSQILLTRDDFKSRKRMLNFRNVLTELLKMGTIPIINENDALSSDEIRVGDNDTLGALVAVAAGASDYVIMSDIDGLYDKNPAKFKDGQIIPTVTAITEDIRKMAGSSGSAVGTGGMITKLDSAEIATKAGITMHIVSHKLEDFAHKLIHQEVMGTEFTPRKNISGHRHWIGFQSSAVGQLTIDGGAITAIRSHKSLLAVGITKASGYFKPGDTIEILAPDGSLVAKGLSNFSSTQVRLIMGKKNSLHKAILQEDVHTSVVHADNMMIKEEEKQ